LLHNIAGVRTSKSFPWWILCGLLESPLTFAVVAPPPFDKDEGNTYDLYVGDQVQYDSNLYRLPPDIGDIATIVAPDATRADGINSAYVGADGQFYLGRQYFLLNLHLDGNRFLHNDTLNNTSGYANGLWNWQASSYVVGQAGVNYNHELASFGETRLLGRDLADTTQFFGTARYQVGPHWALYGRLKDTNVSHSLEEAAKLNNFHLFEGVGGFELDANATDTLAFEYQYSKGTYPATSTFTIGDSTFTQNYTENLTRFVVKYAFSEKSNLDAMAGYRRRQFTTTDLGTYSGIVWRAEFNWLPTEKTTLNFAAWHELHSYLVSESNYYVSDGGSVTGTWNATEKFQVLFTLSYDHQDYIPQSPAGALNQLVAEVQLEQLQFIYSPRRSWIFSATLNRQKRDANQTLYIYDDNIAAVSVLYRMH
jgi:Putative beta-barrel porin 2